MKLGLCLSGGGTKAFAHIGALKALEEENIKFDYLAGTSSGSIVATLYALGYNVNEIHDIFQKYANQINYVDFRNILRILKHFVKTGKIKIDGLNSGEKIYKLMKKLASEKGISNISQIDKPLLIPAVNICKEDLYIFYSKKNNIQKFPNNIKYIGNADIAAVVQASCSYPGIFSPCKYKNTKQIMPLQNKNIIAKQLFLLFISSFMLANCFSSIQFNVLKIDMDYTQH